MPLSFWIDSGTRRRDYLVRDSDRLFLPGETRENDVLTARRLSTPVPAPTVVARRSVSSVALADRVANTCRNIRSSGMHALVVLQGDESKNLVSLTDQLLDEDRGRLTWRYLPVRVAPAELNAQAATLKNYGWALPAPGQLVLVALDGNQHAMAIKTIETRHPTTALSVADVFLVEHLPPSRDARALLAAARDEARNTGRRVWIVHGGPRCGPCFRLGRWIDEQHTILENDYVIVKVMGGLDELRPSLRWRDVPGKRAVTGGHDRGVFLR